MWFLDKLTLFDPYIIRSSAFKASRSRAFSGWFDGFSGLFCAFPFLFLGNPAVSVPVWFFGLVAVSLFGVRAVCSWAFCRVFRVVFLACCVVLRSCIFSLGKEHPPASRPQWRLTPPPVVYWAVPSHPSPAGSRPRYGLVHDGWGVRAPL